MGSLQALRHLSLAQNTRITDASLLVLSALTNLTFLNLSQSRLTGNGIQHLQSLSVRTASTPIASTSWLVASRMLAVQGWPCAGAA